MVEDEFEATPEQQQCFGTYALNHLANCVPKDTTETASWSVQYVVALCAALAKSTGAARRSLRTSSKFR